MSRATTLIYTVINEWNLPSYEFTRWAKGSDKKERHSQIDVSRRHWTNLIRSYQYIVHFWKEVLDNLLLLPGRPRSTPPGQITQWIIVRLGIVARGNCTVCGCPDTGKDICLTDWHIARKSPLFCHVEMNFKWNILSVTYVTHSGAVDCLHAIAIFPKVESTGTVWLDPSDLTVPTAVTGLCQGLFFEETKEGIAVTVIGVTAE